MTIGNWKFEVDGKNTLYLSGQHRSQVEKLLTAWEREFPWEDTWVRNQTGKPSLIVRLDLSVQADGSLGIYEIEERPGGIGICCSLNSNFRTQFSALAEKWRSNFGPITVVVSHRRISVDDVVLKDLAGIQIVKGLPSGEVQNRLFLVRAEPEEEEYWDLARRSISSVKTKGDKRYGQALGLWEPIPNDLRQLPWDRGFALKPKQGSKTRGLYLWHPSKFKGTSTRTRIERMLESRSVHYVQNWIQPETHNFLPEKHFLIRRVFWGWDPEENNWTYLGGMWNARPNTIVHGATDTIHGYTD